MADEHDNHRTQKGVALGRHCAQVILALRAADGSDAAFGGTRLDPAAGDVVIDDGDVASFAVTAREAGDVEVRIEDVRRSS